MRLFPPTQSFAVQNTPSRLFFGMFTKTATRLSALLAACACLLFFAPRSFAQVTSSPSGEIFAAPGATQVFTLTVASGTTLGSVSVLTLGAPNLDFVSVASGTTCPSTVPGVVSVWGASAFP